MNENLYIAHKKLPHKTLRVHSARRRRRRRRRRKKERKKERKKKEKKKKTEGRNH